MPFILDLLCARPYIPAFLLAVAYDCVTCVTYLLILVAGFCRVYSPPFILLYFSLVTRFAFATLVTRGEVMSFVI